MRDVTSLMAVACVALLSSAACGCTTSSTGSLAGTDSPLAGTWSCPYTTDSGYTSTATFVFSVGGDGGASSTTTSLPSAACTLPWSVSGSTATVPSNFACGSYTVTSLTFTATGDTASFSEAAVVHGSTPGPDGGSIPVDLSGTVTGTCTKTELPDGAPVMAPTDASADDGH